MKRNWVFVTNFDFLITISLEPNVVDLRYFKLWILLNQIIRVWNIRGSQHPVLKILGFKYLILLQRFNSFKQVKQFKHLNFWFHWNPLFVRVKPNKNMKLSNMKIFVQTQKGLRNSQQRWWIETFKTDRYTLENWNLSFKIRVCLQILFSNKSFLFEIFWNSRICKYLCWLSLESPFEIVCIFPLIWPSEQLYASSL